MSCEGIGANILNDCDNPLVAGTNDVMYLIHRDDIEFTYNTAYDPDTTGVNQTVITGFTLAMGKYLRKYEGKRNSNAPSYEVKQGTFSDSFVHKLDYKVFSNSPLIKHEIEAQVNKGNLVAIIENNYRGVNEDVAFEVYGAGSGLFVTAASRNPNDADTNGAHSVSLSTSESGSEPRIPLSFVVTGSGTNYSVTKAYIEAGLD